MIFATLKMVISLTFRRLRAAQSVSRDVVASRKF